MRLLHVETGRHLYGGGRQVLYLLEGLAEQGIENHLVTTGGSDLAQAARSLGVQVHELSCRGDLDPLFGIRLLGLIRRIQPGLLHLHSRRGADLWGGVAGYLSRTPVVLSRRVDNPEPAWLVALKYRLFDRVIAISDGIGQVLLRQGLPERKLRVVHSALPVSTIAQKCRRADFQQAFGLPADAEVGAIIAQLIPRKGHDTLLAALPAVLAHRPRLHMLCFGQGPLREELENALQAQGLTDRVQLLGFRADLPDWLACLDLVVHPARMEGLGVALLQAGAAGVPVVATRAGGIPEIIRDQDTGLLIEPDDVAALGAAMLRLLSDRDWARQRGQALRAHVRAQFDARVMVAGNLAVYRELVADRQPPSAT